MRTWPIVKADGSLRGFEITSAWVTFSPLFRILRSVPGVSDVRRNRRKDDRVLFNYYGKPGVVHEPWGDNSRYWVGLENPDGSPDVDIGPIHDAFRRYRGVAVWNLSEWLK